MYNNEDYLRQQLAWVKYRIKALGEIEDRLKEMKELAEHAREVPLTSLEAREVSAKIRKLQEEIRALDDWSRSPLADYQ